MIWTTHLLFYPSLLHDQMGHGNHLSRISLVRHILRDLIRNDVDCFLFPGKGPALWQAEQILGGETIIIPNWPLPDRHLSYGPPLDWPPLV